MENFSSENFQLFFIYNLAAYSILCVDALPAMNYLTRQRKRIFEGSGNHQFQPGQEISD